MFSQISAVMSDKVQMDKDNKKLTKSNKSLKIEVKYLTRKLDEVRERHAELVKDIKRENADKEYETARTHKKELDKLNDKIAELERQIQIAEEDSKISMERLEKAVSLAEERAEEAEECAYEDAISTFEADHAKEIGKIVREHTKELSSIHKEIADAREQAASAAGMNKALARANDQLEDQLEGYQEFAKEVLKSLPNVDLSKFNIDVDVPVQRSDIKVIK